MLYSCVFNVTSEQRWSWISCRTCFHFAPFATKQTCPKAALRCKLIPRKNTTPIVEFPGKAQNHFAKVVGSGEITDKKLNTILSYLPNSCLEIKRSTPFKYRRQNIFQDLCLNHLKDISFAALVVFPFLRTAPISVVRDIGGNAEKHI